MAKINTSDASSFIITTHTNCPHTGKPCGPATELLKRLEAGIGLAHRSGMVEPDFCLDGTVEVTACVQSCTLAFEASAQAIRLVGDVSAADPALVVAESRRPVVH